MSWGREFDPPVPGFKTLRDAAKYMMKLPVSERRLIVSGKVGVKEIGFLARRARNAPQ